MKVPVNETDIKRWVAKMAQAINEITLGKLECTGWVTLNANQATTVVTNYNLTKDSVIIFDPTTANAAAEKVSGNMYVGDADIDPTNNQFTINHTNDANADKTFRYAVIGQTRRSPTSA